ncbi:hypothetical protein FisN_12Hh106 [Fistulifera solaris]|uniref:Endonuclease/exonuclease/phosphatase domain-containing protein n=1 Tax=Fistulifera solaris TaxID=1519565 RepID=A0A1Z5KRI3_FISSO|nr:hypothetical protein FisN_12Hh106 [Fistulifera solaris]|eukprot:GAX28528.1 hypothetical protein FisN_12Hh106 [Fistulifera solaris]
MDSIDSTGAALGGTTTAQVSREEMRQRRLEALGQVGSSTETSAAAAAPSSRSTARHPIYDLCDTDDDDDVKDESPQTRAASNESVGDDDDRVNLLDCATVPPAQSTQSSLKTSSSSRKRPAAALSSIDPASPASFQIVTYNLWFQMLHPTERMKAIAQILSQCHKVDSPLVMVGFQEVIPPLASVLFPALELQGYSIVRQPIQLVPYGCAMAIRNDVATILDWGFRPFRHSIMNRGILFARVRLSTAQEFLFTTTHLESPLGEDRPGSTERQSQILEMEAFCVQTLSKYPNVQSAVITGDLNWDDERARSADPVLSKHLKKPWKDAWEYLHGDNKNAVGYTYDAKLNPMIGGNFRRRLDRILLYPDNASLVQRTEILGKEALPGLSCDKTNPYNNSVHSVPVAPSDHFGLLAQVTVEANLK